ncbi:hypothetical protein C7U61_16165 [Rhizobium sp. JAB6]|nr:hypothetical protein C7U61_16165 [Rhizobium sp. JAB6]
MGDQAPTSIDGTANTEYTKRAASASATRRPEGSPRAVQLSTESPNRSVSLLSRNSRWKTATHLSWSCSRRRELPE